MTSSFSKPIRILMLDRDDGAVRLARESLELAGLPAVVDAFRTARDALAAAPRGYDVVLADLALARADGFVEQLRGSPATKRLPLIGLSDGADADADHVFRRPRDEAEFMGVVAAIKFFWMHEAPSLPPPPKSGPSQRPERHSSIDLMSLPIEPAEAYLLSVLDGQMSVDELSSVLGTPVERTRKMLRRLAELGAVRWQAPHPSLPPPPPPMPASSPPAEIEQPAMPEAREIALAMEEDAPAPERFTAERRQRIDDAYALLDEADHYEILGVSRDADRRQIREAYFALAKLFHSDTLYGVELGDYRRKMDRVFQALTEAYDVLGKKKSRQAYDEYLGAVRETAALDAPAASTDAKAPPAGATRNEATAESTKRSDASAPAAQAAPSDRSAGSPRSAEPVREVPSATSSGRTPRLTKSETMRAVARQRARELRTQGRRDASPPPAGEDAIASLRRTLKEVSRTAVHVDRAARLIAEAREAERIGNVAGAAEALRIAVAWRPDDAALKEQAERVRADAVREKAGAYEKRARYAQERLRWEEAARCWVRVADARPDDREAHASAALSLLRANANLSRAARYAQHAIDLAPSDAGGHRLLGQIYAAANKPASAKRSLVRAIELDPKDDDTRRQLRELE